MGLVIGRRAGADRVEIAGIFLCLHQTLPAAGGASQPIRVLRVLAVIRLDQRLRFHHRLVHRTIGEVHQLLGMAQPPRPVSALVAGVRPGRGVAFAQRRPHIAETLDRSRHASVAHHLELAVPVFGGQPYFHVDVRIRGRRQRDRHAAVGRQHHGSGSRSSAASSRLRSSCPSPRRLWTGSSPSTRRWSASSRRSSRRRTGRNHLQRGNGRIRQRNRLQTLAGSLRQRDAQGAGSQQGECSEHGFKNLQQ